MFAALIERFHEWRDRRSAFRELRIQKSIDAPYEGFEVGTILNRVKTGAFREHVPDTLAAWNELRARAPDLAITSASAIRALMHIKQYELVETALTEAQEKFSGSETLMALYAELAQRQGRWEDANARWTALRQSFPGFGGAYTFGGMALSQLGRYDEASKLLENWVHRRPDDIVGATEYARVAELQGDLNTAAERWRRMQQHIHDVQGWIGEAKALAALGREEDAIKVLESARWRFQGSARPMVEMTLLAQAHCSPEEALLQWARVREHFPAAPDGYTHPACLLRSLDRIEEAEAILQRYVDRDLGESEPVVEFARFAHGRDWPEACRRWAIVRERFPDRKEGFTWGADALDAAGDHEQAAAIRAFA